MAFSLILAVSGTIVATSGVIIAVTLAFIVEYSGNISLIFAVFFVFIFTGFIVSIGYPPMKSDEKNAWIHRFAVAISTIGGTSFFKAILTEVNFTNATFKNTNFYKSNLTHTCFKNAVKLDLARPGNTLLADPTIRDLIINPSSGEGKDFTKANLRGAYLNNANLKRANLKQADISQASFQYANLADANLTEFNAVKTDFSNACFTGTCIEKWNIDEYTKLDNIDCKYVFLLEKLNEHDRLERRPNSGDFKPGEFTVLFKEVFDTVDLIFDNGIDWKAFLETIKEVQVQNEDMPLEVTSIENKGNGVFVVKVKVPIDSDKEKIHRNLIKEYNRALQSLEAEYKAQLDAKDNEIIIYRQQNSNLMFITILLASRSTYHFKNTIIKGGLAVRDYTGDVINNNDESS